jgi:cell division protein FtsI (penicillin-binding protein 3)
VETATISYGQGVTATLMQLVMGVAALANQGVRMQPILVDRVEDAEGNVLRSWSPTVVSEVVSPEVASMVMAAMESVTQDDSTAPRARIAGYRVAGKTGTAYKVVAGKYSETARYSTFVGAAPADAPRYAMAILVDEATVGSRFGGVVAAPVFPAVIGPALHRAGVPRDASIPGPPSYAAQLDAMHHTSIGGTDATSLLAVAPSPAPGAVLLSWTQQGWLMPDLVGRDARSAITGLQGSGLSVRVLGSGFVAEQQPEAGAVVEPGTSVSLSLRP